MSLFHFELIICARWEIWIEFYSFKSGYPVSPAPFIKQAAFCQCGFFSYTFVKNWVAIAVLVYFWVLNNVPFVYMSIFAPMSPYLCPHGSVAQFEVNIGIPLAVSFCLELLWLSVIFYINLRIFFSVL